jgi:flagellar basal-body rod modification protein FlgD
MQVTSPTNSLLGAATSTGSPASAATAPSQTLGINDFMKLLATQFEEQDPLQPMDDTAFIAQTAQFTALQQTTTLTQNMTQMAANSYIGRQVMVNSSTGQTVTGTVSGVDTSGTTPNLLINGAEYPLSNLLSIDPPTASSTPSTTPASTPATTPAAPSTSSSAPGS